MINRVKSKLWHTEIRTVCNGIKKIDPGLVVLFVLPLVFLGITRLWLFPRLGHVDSWMYFRYFIRPVQLLYSGCHFLFLPDQSCAYANSRLPWTMVGALVYHLFPPLVATYVLHLGFYYATVLSTYGTLHCTVGKRSGFLAALLLGTYGYFMLSQNWDYVEVAVLAYCSLTVFLLTLASQFKPGRLALFAAGCCYGAMVYSNTTAIFLTPALTVYYFLSNHRYRRHPILSSIGYTLLGLLSVTLFLGVPYYVVTGAPFFFMAAVEYTFAAVRHGYGAITQPGWFVSFNEHHWLWLPFLLSCTSLLCLLSRAVQPRRDRTLALSLPIFSLTFLLCLFPYLLLELRGQGLLRIVYYASYLIPSTFLALGEQIAPVVERLNHRVAGGLILGTVVLQILTFRQLLHRMVSHGFSYAASLPEVQNLLHGTVGLVVTVLVGLLLVRFIPGAVSKKLRQWVTLKLILMVTVLGFYYCFNFQALFTVFSSDNGTWSRLFYTSIPEDSMLATVQAHDILRKIDPKVQMLFWFQENESIVFSMIDSNSLARDQKIGWKLPTLTRASEEIINLAKVRFGKLPKLVLLSQSPDIMQQANVALESIGFTSNLVSSHDIIQGDIHFKMIIVEVVEKRSAKVS